MTLAENSPFIAAERVVPEKRRSQLDSLERTIFHAEVPNGSG
jgi:hypothetical protein